MILSVAYPAVPVDDFFLAGHLHEGHELVVQVHFNTKRNQYLKWLIHDRFHKHPNGLVIPPRAHPHSLPVGFLNPSPLQDLMLVLDDISVLLLNID